MAENRPRVGDFRSPPGNEPRTSPPAESPKTKSAETTLAPPAPATPEPDETPEAEKPPAELTAKERYLKRLEENKIPRETAAAIYDAVIEKGYYEEYITIGKHKAVFRTRLYDDTLRLQTALEATRPALVVTQEDMITRYNLASSLYAWRGTAYSHETDEEFDKVMAVVKKLSAPLYSLMVQKLAEFDHKVMTIFSEGATDSF